MGWLKEFLGRLFRDAKRTTKTEAQKAANRGIDKMFK